MEKNNERIRFFNMVALGVNKHMEWGALVGAREVAMIKTEYMRYFLYQIMDINIHVNACAYMYL